MKIGDLVKWHISWVTSKRLNTHDNNDYASMVGVLVEEWLSGYVVLWSDGKTRTCHIDYLEAL